MQCVRKGTIAVFTRHPDLKRRVRTHCMRPYIQGALFGCGTPHRGAGGLSFWGAGGAPFWGFVQQDMLPAIQREKPLTIFFCQIIYHIYH